MVSHAHAARLEPWVSVGVFPNDDGVGCVGRAAGCARPDGHPLQPGAARPCRVFPRRIAGARLVELPGLRSIYHWVDRRANEIALTETRRIADLAVREPTTERVLSTVLFTDLVGSTERAVEAGDAAWADILGGHHALVRRQLDRFRGQEIDNAGDGFLAAFDGPARAILCARAITEAMGELGLQVRSGLHTGECELVGEKLGGIAVHIGA